MGRWGGGEVGRWGGESGMRMSLKKKIKMNVRSHVMTQRNATQGMRRTAQDAGEHAASRSSCRIT